jgi:hypothetical protein
MLTAEFPEVPAAFDDSAKGLLHCEMGTFARLTEEAIDRGSHWQVEKYFRFLDRVRKNQMSGTPSTCPTSNIWLSANGLKTDIPH